MRLLPTDLAGCWLVELEPHVDERGFFARSYCRSEFLAAGLEPVGEQSSISFNTRAGTLRGMHWQVAPGLESKLVRCTAGAVHDTVVDLRPGSPTRLQSFSVELSARNRLALYVPPLFAHGFQTLVDNTEVAYQISSPHLPETSRGLRHDDPALALRWPLDVTVVSAKDCRWPLLPP